MIIIFQPIYSSSGSRVEPSLEAQGARQGTNPGQDTIPLQDTFTLIPILSQIGTI